jgi:hypothetical protein
MKRATSKNVVAVLEKLTDFVRKEDKDVQKLIAAQVDAMLDEMAAGDLFGTEGQLDPRGDGRN